MSEIEVDVYKAGGLWRIRKRTRRHRHGIGNGWDSEDVATYKRKSEAVLVGRFYAHLISQPLPVTESVELTIKDRKGRIQEKSTFGYDPIRSKG